MPQSASAAAWRTPDRPRWPARFAKAAAIGLFALFVTQYLAGFLFLWWFRLDPREARPLTVIRYVYYYGDRADVRRRAWLSSAAGLSLLLLPAIALAVPKPRPLHGNARFATTQEIRNAGLLGNTGIILGRLDRGSFWNCIDRLLTPCGFRPIILGGQTGVALSAESGAGKNVSAVTPNLLEWCDSAVITDPKNENFILTAGYRRSIGQEVHLLDPLSPEGKTARWNPLDYVSQAPGQRVSDVQLIAHMFFPDPMGADPFWAAGGRSLFLGIALYLFETPSLPRTIGEILRQGMASDEEGFAAHWKRVIKGRQSGTNPLSDTCVKALFDIIDLAPQTASSIRRTFTSRLELWANPILDAATAASDFDLRDLRRKRMSIYIGVAPKDLDRLSPLISLFFQQAIALQTDELPEHNAALRYQVLMILDEIPAFGRIPILTKSAGYLRAFGLRLFLIMQAPSQIKEAYGEHGAKTLLKTMAARIFFAPKDIEDANELSSELGFTTVKVRSISKPRLRLFDPKGNRAGSTNVSEQKRPLMLPQELKEMGRDREILLIENLRPIYCKKILYYRIPRYQRRVLDPPVVAAIAPIPAPVRATPAGAAAGEPASTNSDHEKSAPAGPKRRKRSGTARTRPATVADVERMQELTLDDFAADFSQVQIPKKAPGERMTEVELQVAVDSFLATLHER